MLRFLNIVAIVVLVGSAVYAYSIKYQTSYRAEQITKTKIEIRQERDAIAVLRAEWAYMTRPERIQQLADKYLSGMKQVDATQIVSAQSLPERSARVDSIGEKLDSLGLSMPATPPVSGGASTMTPKAQGQERPKP
jgi:cell division protein FtsL